MQARERCLILKLGNHLVSLSQMSVKPHVVSSIGARWKSFDCSQTFSRSVLILLSCFMYKQLWLQCTLCLLWPSASLMPFDFAVLQDLESSLQPAMLSVYGKIVFFSPVWWKYLLMPFLILSLLETAWANAESCDNPLAYRLWVGRCHLLLFHNVLNNPAGGLVWLNTLPWGLTYPKVQVPSQWSGKDFLAWPSPHNHHNPSGTQL